MTPTQKRLLGLLLTEDEETQSANRRWWVRPIFQRPMQEGSLFRRADFMREHDQESFRNFFRMTPMQFDYILSIIHDDITASADSVREPIPAKHRLAVVLRYLASGDSMASLSYACAISTCSVSKYVTLVCEALWLRLMPIVMPVPDTDTWYRIAHDMDEKWQLPNCVGAIDGKHCYAGSHSIVLLAVCDSNYRFRLVDIGASGRNSDGGIFSASAFGRAINEGTLGLPPPSNIYGVSVPIPYYFVGDAAFPLKDNLMRPYPGRNLSYEERVCNYRFSRVRRLIENSFGIMSARFRIFRGPICANVETVCSITKAAVCLHNYLLASDLESPDCNKKYCPPRFNDTEDEEHNLVLGAWRQQTHGFLNLRPSSHNSPASSARYRDLLKYFTNGPGTVSWQRSRVLASS